MKKLELDLDTLEVQSFVTESDLDAGGTVVGAEDAGFLRGTRVTRCYSECNVCTYTNCNPEQRTEIDCVC